MLICTVSPIGHTDHFPCDIAPTTNQLVLKDCPLHDANRLEIWPKGTSLRYLRLFVHSTTSLLEETTRTAPPSALLPEVHRRACALLGFTSNSVSWLHCETFPAVPGHLFTGILRAHGLRIWLHFLKLLFLILFTLQEFQTEYCKTFIKLQHDHLRTVRENKSNIV